MQVNGGSIAPITAIQFGVNRALEKGLKTANNGVLDKPSQIAIAAMAGASSSLLGCPAELLMIQQQKSGHSLVQQASQFIAKHGVSQLYRGFVSHCSPPYHNLSLSAVPFIQYISLCHSTNKSHMDCRCLKAESSKMKSKAQYATADH